MRVILVGRTGLDGALRLDPAIELVRVPSPLEAVAELASPLIEPGSDRSVVVVGEDAERTLRDTNGQTNRMTEFTPSNKPVFAIDFGGDKVGYRSFPIPHGRISAQQLRKGMDAILTTGRGEIAASR